MPDYYGNIAQAGAYMMNSGLDAIASQRKLEAEKEMQAQRIAAQERARADRQSGGGSFGGNDPISKGARAFTSITSALNAHSDEQINLSNELLKLDKTMQERGFGTDDDNIQRQRIQARMQNNDFALKMMTKSLGGGKFEYQTTDADGSTVKAVFDSAADLEAYKSMFKGNAPEIAAEKNNSLLTSIFGEKKTAPSQASSDGAGMSEPEPVQRQNADLPEGFIPSEEEVSSKQAEVNDIKKELAKKMAQRDAELKNTGYRPNVVVGAAGAGMATSARSARSSDKDRAARVRNLDKEIAKLKSRIGESGD